MKKISLTAIFSYLVLLGSLTSVIPAYASRLAHQTDSYDPNPPESPVKLIFIHHSTGENWLADGYGNLGISLAENNYFVSDTNYGWGPDNIGDRTDIPDWLEWFTSDQTNRYMDALLAESDQHAGYTRLFEDPGGTNRIVIFKSCFPNSALEGSPDDPPDPEGWLTVGHAKYVYNEILDYFQSRPDILFVVITAPPLSDPEYAANARAFNEWLVNSWLEENDYPLPNVAVFDFYNILTDPDAHHRFAEGWIEHSEMESDTLAYPSGDDHPSEAGSRKATEEFLPLLNIFYNRWAGTAPHEPSDVEDLPEESESSAPSSSGMTIMISDFESGLDGWEAIWDAATETSISCTLDESISSRGTSSMRMDFSVSPGSWALCSWSFDTPQDWSSTQGLVFDVNSNQADLPLTFLVYGGSDDELQTFGKELNTSSESMADFILFRTAWSEIIRVDWEEDAGQPFSQTDHVLAIAFGFDAPPENGMTGTVWVDDISLDTNLDSNEETSSPGRILPCLGFLLFPLSMFCLSWLTRRRML